MNNSFDVIFFNGDYIKANDLHISSDDRAFRYGDGLFETMHANGRKVQFYDEHTLRLRRGIDLLKLKLPAIYTNEYIAQCIDGVLQRCRLYQGASVKLSIWRRAKGKYISDNSSINILLEAQYLSEGPYVLNNKGLIVGVYKDIKKPINPIFTIKSCNGLIYIMAGIYATENNFDDVILLNDAGYIVEATSSNIFCIKGNKLITPSLKTGCLPGIMRQNILKIATDLAYEIHELDNLEYANLLNVDEIFLTNANCGIKWITGYENKRFMNRVSRKLMLALNEQTFNSTQD